MNSLIKIIRRNLLLFSWLPVMIIVMITVSGAACSKESSNETDSTGFILTSPEILSDSLLPKEYTCDGESATLPLRWSGAPEGTKYFALIMHHEASATDIHWYWVLYNIPLSVQSLEKNISGIGTLGNNSVNGNTAYAPPCSQGPGAKLYTYTLYALSQPVTVTVPASEVSREVLLEAIKNTTLSTTTLTVVYSREL